MKNIVPYPLASVILLTFLAGNPSITFAQINLNQHKVAVSGYDIISYHQSKPMLGREDYKVTYQDAIYLFKNETHKNKFKSNPEKYIPQYGGWCAYAMGKNGEKVKIDPQSYTLEQGKLYLFYKSAFNDTRKKWINNTESLKSKANENCKNLIKN